MLPGSAAVCAPHPRPRRLPSPFGAFTWQLWLLLFSSAFVVGGVLWLYDVLAKATRTDAKKKRDAQREQEIARLAAIVFAGATGDEEAGGGRLQHSCAQLKRSGVIDKRLARDLERHLAALEASAARNGGGDLAGKDAAGGGQQGSVSENVCPGVGGGTVAAPDEEEGGIKEGGKQGGKQGGKEGAKEGGKQGGEDDKTPKRPPRKWMQALGVEHEQEKETLKNLGE